MTTTVTTTLLASLAALTAACAPIGHPGQRETPDAGTAAKTCDSPVLKTANVTLSGSGSSMSPEAMPTGCWKLNGSLTISGSTTTLAALGDLVGVSDLVIKSGALTTIDTAMPLEVTRSLDIEDNAHLTSLSNIVVPDDASCLTYIGTVDIERNPALTDLGGVANLMCVSGAVKISNNVALTQVKLDQAKRLEGGLTVSYNTAMTTLSLGAVASITGDLNISNNANLTTFTTLSALTYMHGNVVIDSNAKLAALPSSMKNPGPVVEQALTITNNAALTDLGYFKYLGGVNGIAPLGINISNNSQLNYCEAREIGCCVGHSGKASISTGNKGTSCSTGHSWCWAANGNSCPYQYTGQ
jgi:hypothetical protein